MVRQRGSAASSAALRRRVEDALRAGVATVVQPIVDLDTGTVVGVESLARFDDERGPQDWFADAAAAGLGVELEVAAARAGLARLSELPPGAYLTVNVSPDAASSGALADALAATPGGRIVLEITEHAPVRDYEVLCSALERLRGRGFRIAIDDAGAGFASMAHVLRLHPDVIKLDISLTRAIDSDPQRRALVRALVDFARTTGCTIVAEGIETAAQLATLRTLGVQCGQGFHLGMPGPMPLGWRVPVVRRRRIRTRARRRSAAQRAGGIGRVMRPAALMLTAALAWPGISAVANLTRSAPGPGIEQPAAESRQRLSPIVRVPAPPPRPSITSDPVARASANAVTPAAPVRTSSKKIVKPAPCAGVLTGTVCQTVNTTLVTADQLLDHAATAVGQVLQNVGGLVHGLLGNK